MAIQIKDFNIYITFPVQTVFRGNNSTSYLEKILLYMINMERLTELENCHLVNPNEIIDSGKNHQSLIR